MPDLNNLLNKYPGNERVYEHVKNLLTERSAIAFIGAGASSPLYPLWDQLIEQLSDKTICLGLANENDKAYWLRNIESQPLEMVSLIRKKFTKSHYDRFLSEIFGPRTGTDGKRYTSIHAALMRMNFKGYVTTNYDQGLLDARQEICPEIGHTGFSVWNHETQIKEWLSGDIFHKTSQPPILFAHGYHDYPENIILDDESYSKAYVDNSIYRRLIETLWLQEHLVFVGFGFVDFTLKWIVKKAIRHAITGPRHVAFVGLPEENSYTPDMRHNFLKTYNTEIIFYPVNRTNQGLPDHSALNILLQALCPEAITKHAEQVFGQGKAVTDAGEMKKVFISYVREDKERVECLVKDLRRHLLNVSTDFDIKLGIGWSDDLRRSIQEGDYFLACFSREYERTKQTYMNEVLTIAIKELRQKHLDECRLIPIKLSKCDIPDIEIGAGETLKALQWVKLFDDWESGIKKIVQSLGCENNGVPRERIAKYAEQVFGLMREGRFGPENMRSTDSATLKEWQNGVKKGWKEAQWLMGLCYRFGIGGIAKLNKAAELFEQSAEQGYPPAALCLDFDRQLADCIYRASNGGECSFTLEDVGAIALLRSPWPGPSYNDDSMEIFPYAWIARKMKNRMYCKDRAATCRYFETTSGQRFVVDCLTKPEFLGVRCSIRKYSV